VNDAIGEIDLRPGQRDELGDAQPVGISDQDRRGIARSVPPTFLRRLKQNVDLGRCQVLARPDLAVPPACRWSRVASEF
jgi:hypothetical protein